MQILELFKQRIKSVRIMDRNKTQIVKILRDAISEVYRDDKK